VRRLRSWSLELTRLLEFDRCQCMLLFHHCQCWSVDISPKIGLLLVDSYEFIYNMHFWDGTCVFYKEVRIQKILQVPLLIEFSQSCGLMTN